MVADVVVENASYSFDIPFSYRVPGRMEGQIRPGCRVLVPFGRSNRSKQGLVLHLQPQDPQSQQLKPIKMLLDQKPLLGEEQLWLLELLHQRTFCTYYEGLRALVPSGLTFRLKLMTTCLQRKSRWSWSICSSSWNWSVEKRTLNSCWRRAQSC